MTQLNTPSGDRQDVFTTSTVGLPLASSPSTVRLTDGERLELTAVHRSLAADIERPPDKVLGFTALMPLLYGEDLPPSDSYTCPMHADVTSTEPGTCPRCGMLLVPVHAPAPAATLYACPMHPEITSTEPGTCPKCGMRLVPASEAAPASPAAHDTGAHTHAGGDGIEWEDLMPAINRQTNATNMIWKLVDRQTGDENGVITWNFTVGDQVKIRLVNEMEGSEHPMHHPFHIHGAGRFLVLSREGVAEENLVWKDTVRPVTPWTSCWTSPIPGCGWRIATSPSTTRAG